MGSARAGEGGGSFFFRVLGQSRLASSREECVQVAGYAVAEPQAFLEQPPHPDVGAGLDHRLASAKEGQRSHV